MTASTFPAAKPSARFARSPSATIRPVDLLVGLVLMTSALRWFTVLSFGSVSIEPVHVALLLLTLYFYFSVRTLGEISVLLSYAPLFWIFYAAYLLLSVAFLLRKGFNPTITALLPQFLYVPAFFAVYVCLFKAALGGGGFKYYLGTGAAIILFFLTLGISAEIGGADLEAAWSGLVSGGSFYAFNRAFTKAIFSSSGFQSSISSAQFIEYSTSIKNELASCVVVLYAIMRSLRDFRPNWWSRCFEIVCFGIVSLIVVLSFSRSAFLGFALALTVGFAVPLLAGRPPVDRTFLLAIGFLTAATAIAVLSNVGAVLLESFEDSTSYEERLEQFNAAVQIIEDNIWSGTGTNIEIAGHDVHNLFLATWAKSGFFPFLAVLLAYLLMLGIWLVAVLRTLTVRSFWQLPNNPGWVFAIPIVPLLRVYLSGKGGTFSISMWLGTAAFLAFVVANRAAIAQAFHAGSLEASGEHG